ncbi:hypothetical protein V5799_008461 [Amblyomma americanum]|uniref:Uncharacterized protein n=1 Tax=Amblyomma americanum TaxID=6943 RepID=A0AAQ4FEV3_AMBAM
MRYFVPYLAHDIEDNYTFTHVRLDHVTWNGGAYTCRIMDTVRRNFGLVSRASQFLSAGHCDRFCSPHALKTVQMHPALMAELAEVLSVGDTEAADMIRDGIRSLEDDMHVFMRVIGIAGERIECCPRQDGRAQLDSLNEYCLREIRRYLRFEDVKCSSERESGERRQRDVIPFI